ncbi:ABC transporter permease [Pseudobacter ginsenosidimutans]|uniref:Putative ABC transport system permease protein n=1 Tax=Pseudobacter ginsenosidimutans TaxID=661488 RepID=A0A4Q7N3G6_9BACT|nr:ABC transporter permease [Pseudobacter ginsenosidimutans]QEC43686.1 FtsX-like permease family protein [Pseudobacter ginsenosidimutans]RZS75088.1 putative ABC transport system permease protein [Pseudobacter ginsenosidimutans]
MFKNYFITAWRNLNKNKAFSFINIQGLTIGITVCMMIFLFIINEFSFDNFHKDGSRIYRVMRGFKNEGSVKHVAYLSGMYGPAIANEFTGQVEEMVRVSQNNNLVTIGSQSFHEKGVIAADSNFFQFFSYRLLAGDPNTVLKNPNSVVLTESTARKYFGSTENVIGKTIMLDKQLPLTVTGIAKDLPSNSHLEFDMVLPLDNYRSMSWMTTWMNNALYTYVRLAPSVTQARIEQQLPAFMTKYMGSDMKKYGFRFSLSLLPLKDVYFANQSFDGVRHGDKTVVYIFLSIAILILLIACINFINLSTIRATERSKEVGLRKVLGAMRTNIIWQFIGESVLLTIISCILSLGLLLIILPWYNQLLGYTLTVSWSTWPIYLFLAGVILVAGLLAGSYPAFILSAFSPHQALKGRLRLGKSGASFRQALVVVQFSISVFLIIGSFVITKQMNYIRNKQLGYHQEQTILVKIDNDDIYRNMLAFKSELQAESRIHSVAMMSGEPGGFFDGHVFDVEGHSERWYARTEFTDFEFVKTLGLKIIAGRDFSPTFPTDTMKAVLINRTAAAKLGWSPDQAVGKWIENTLHDTDKRSIIGVVEDFNFQSLKSDIEPLVIAPREDKRVAVVRLNPGNISEAVAAVEKAYKKAASAYPFQYSFLDQQFDRMYKKDISQQTILTGFAGMAIFVACLGLFGLASFTAIKRFKEIGVRKVLGSSVQGIVVLLTKDLLKPVMISTCIALPAGYWAMNNWLNNFAYKTSLNWWVFVLAASITFLIAFITICFKAIQAALTNPVQSLRSE